IYPLINIMSNNSSPVNKIPAKQPYPFQFRKQHIFLGGSIATGKSTLGSTICGLRQ
ncbi:hypothetical protein ENUP19_0382G0009, partial [Entamoeba nuttalli]